MTRNIGNLSCALHCSQVFVGSVVLDSAKSNELRVRESSHYLPDKREKTLAGLEVVCETRETAFHHISKHEEAS